MVHSSRNVRRLALGAVLALVPASLARAQQIPSQLPTPEQASRLLETRPDLVAMLRAQIASSGLTPPQIRERLKAAGYPEDFLDSYLAGSGARDSLSGALPSENVLTAVAALGLTDSTNIAQIRDRLHRGRALPLDRVALDSLKVLRYSSERLRRLAASDSGFTIYGLDIFGSTTTQFDANPSAAVDATYRLGAGDRLVLIITGDAERAFTLDVTREGFVVVPGVGEIPVANVTIAQLEDLLYARLGRVYSGLRRGAGATTHFSLTLARLHSNQVLVLGDVEQPGSYHIPSTGTALTALYAAGGPSPNGSLRQVEVRRGGRIVDSLDVYEYLLRGNASHDVRLESGDVVFVPVHGPRVRIYGEVVRPATYELRRGETLADVLRDAGGFTAEAARRRVQVSRILPPSQRDTTDRARIVIDIAADQASSGDAPPFPIEPGDIVHVFAVNDAITRRVVVNGDVWSPGAIGYAPGMRLSDALRLVGGIKPDAFRGQVLLTRLRPADSTRVQLRTALGDSTGAPVQDLYLADNDEIQVFSATELHSLEYVAITGAVRHAGRFDYREGMTLRDLVLLAGGLEERASLDQAEIARMPRERRSGQLAVSQRVDLDSTYALASHRSRQGPPGGATLVSQQALPRDVTLEPYDNVLIFAQPDWEQPRKVVVSGEVRLPGTYTLLTKRDRLSDVLARAGGLTNAAFAGGIVFYRKQGGVGRVGVDLSRVLRDPADRDNLLLEDGDSIALPQFDPIVEVQGAVNVPHGVPYVPGANLEYYVRAAGGATRKADIGRSYVTQPNGSVESVVTRHLLPDDMPVPLPGSVVHISEVDQPEKTDVVARLSVLAQVIGGLVALAALLRRP